MSIPTSQKKQLCKVPELLQFQYYPEQQMHAFIQLENLTDEIISFRLKTNTPSEYLVKPMEGQIYKKEKMKIIYKRKKILQSMFDQFITGVKPVKEKFMVNVTCKTKNPIGIEKTNEEIYYVGVRFINPRKPLIGQQNQSKQQYQHSPQQQLQTSPIKKAKKPRNSEQTKQLSQIMSIINSQKANLNQLKQVRMKEQSKLQNLVRKTAIAPGETMNGASRNNSIQQLSLAHIICLIVIFMLLGLWI